MTANKFLSDVIANRKERLAGLQIDINFFELKLEKLGDENKLRESLSAEKGKKEEKQDKEVIAKLESIINKINEIKNTIKEYGFLKKDLELYLKYVEDNKANLSKDFKDYFTK